MFYILLSNNKIQFFNSTNIYLLHVCINTQADSHEVIQRRIPAENNSFFYQSNCTLSNLKIIEGKQNKII